MDKHDAPSHRDESLSLSSLYGMTPKVETAVITALAEGKTQRVRALVAPLHPADQADLVERLNTAQRRRLFVMIGPVLDPETLAFIDEDLLEEALGIIGAEGVARALPELDSDDVVDILQEFEPEERDEILAAMPVAERLIVQEGLSYPEDSAGRMMQREVVVARLTGLLARRLILCAASRDCRKIFIQSLLLIRHSGFLVR